MIKVIIDRRIADGLGHHYDQCLRESVNILSGIPGFLGSETLKDISNANHRVTVSLWENADAWHQWRYSDSRRNLQCEIQQLLTTDEQITLLSH